MRERVECYSILRYNLKFFFLAAAMIQEADLQAELNKITYMLIVGETEATNGTVAARRQGQGDIGEFSIDGFAKLIEEEINKAQ